METLCLHQVLNPLLFPPFKGDETSSQFLVLSLSFSSKIFLPKEGKKISDIKKENCIAQLFGHGKIYYRS